MSAYGSFERFQEVYQAQAVPLFLTDDTGELTIIATDQPLVPRLGQVVISLMRNPAPQTVVEAEARPSPV